MFQRYFDLKDTLNTMDDATAALMPTRREENKLKGLLEELKAFESSSKKLQSADGLSLLGVRDIFDALIVEHPGLEGYLGSDAAIIHHPVFEDACVTVLMGKANSLTQQPRTLLLPFEAPATPAAVLEDRKFGFADRVLKKRKLLREQPCEYPELKVVPPTSNMCEHFPQSSEACVRQPSSGTPSDQPWDDFVSQDLSTPMQCQDGG